MKVQELNIEGLTSFRKKKSEMKKKEGNENKKITTQF